MYHIINDYSPGHPLCQRSEVRIYNSSADLNRALTQLRRLPGVHCTAFRDIHGPAIQIGRWRHGPFLPTPSILNR